MGTCLSCPHKVAPPNGTDDDIPKEENADGYWHLACNFWWEQWPLTLANTMEWYEFAVYSNMEPYISQALFGGSTTEGWVFYSVSFIVRSIGGVAFGAIADRYGRRPAVLATLTMMCAATVGQGLTPAINILGPTWMLTCRIMQGLAIGGEEGSVSVFLAEQSATQTLTMSGMINNTGGQIGFALSSLISLALLGSLGNDQMVSWGWRIPFLLVIIPGVFSVYRAYSMPETGAYEDLHRDPTHETWTASHQVAKVKELWVQGVLTLTGSASNFVISFLAGAYLQEWLTTWCGASSMTAFWVIFANQALCIPFSLPFAWYGDHYGLGKLNALASAMALVTAIPMYAALYVYPNSMAVLVVAGVLVPAVIGGSVVGVYPFVASLFPTEVRGFGFCSYWNLAGLAGGLAPTICASTGNPMFVGYYTAFFAAISLVASIIAIQMHDTHQETGTGPCVSFLRSDIY